MEMISPFLIKLVNNREKCGNCVVLQRFQFKGKRSSFCVNRAPITLSDMTLIDMNFYCVFFVKYKSVLCTKTATRETFPSGQLFLFLFFKRKFSSLYFYAHCFFLSFF